MQRTITPSIEGECRAFRRALEQVGPGPALGGGPGPVTSRIPSAEHGCPCELCGKYGCSCPPDPEKKL